MPKAPDGGSWFVTASGAVQVIRRPDIKQIRITDIAASLAKICRFNGHCRDFYSVGQHSVLACQVAPEALKFAALMHDAHEAYVQDVIAPLKWEIGNAYREIEIWWSEAVAARFAIELSRGASAVIKGIDLRLLATERRDLMAEGGPDWKDAADFPSYPNFTIKPVDWQTAERQFLECFDRYAPAGASL